MTQTPIKPVTPENTIDTFKQNNDNTTLELTKVKQKSLKKKSSSLNKKLLQTILPTVLIPLVLAGWFGYRNVQEKEEKRIADLLLNETLLTGEITNNILDEAWKIPTILAKNPLIINAARQSAIKAQNEGLTKLKIEELEAKFAQTKLLEVNLILNNYLKTLIDNTEFAEVFFTDKNGFNIAYSNPTSDFVQSDEEWWKKGKEKEQFLDFAGFDESSQTFGLEFSQKITDPQSGEFLGVIKALLPSSVFESLTSYLQRSGIKGTQKVQFIDPISQALLNTITEEGSIKETEIIGQEVILEISSSLIQAIENPGVNLSELAASLEAKYPLTIEIKPFEYDTVEIAITAYLSYQNRQYAMATIPKTSWVVITSIDESEIQQAGRELIQVFAQIGLILGLISIGVVLLLAKKLSQPLIELSDTANQVAEGNFDILTQGEGVAETENLADILNNLIAKVKILLGQQEKSQQETLLLAEIASQAITDTDKVDQIFNRGLEKAGQLLNCDRLVIYRFREDFSGYISNESVSGDWVSAMSTAFEDACIPEELLAAYRNGRVLANENVFEAGFHPDHVALMERLQVKANLIVPLLSEGELFGLLIAHHCSKNHQWQESEINFLERLAVQIGVTLDRIRALQKEQQIARQQKEAKE
jgi:HAMP domain-containing protein